MGIFGGILSSLAGGAVSGLMGGSGGGSGGGTQTVINDLPDWLQPYYSGGSDNYAGNIWPKPPISDDALAWNSATGQGMMPGPPPPLYTNDPRYTGQNVYQAPNTQAQPMPSIANTGMGGLFGSAGGYGRFQPNFQPSYSGGYSPQSQQMMAAGGQMPQGFGAPFGGKGRMPLGPASQMPGGGFNYPSQNRPQSPVPAGPALPPAAGPQGGMPSDFSKTIDLANHYMRERNLMGHGMDETIDPVGFGDALRWATDNPQAQSSFQRSGR